MLDTQTAPETFRPQRDSTPGVLILLGICTLIAIGILHTATHDVPKDHPNLPFIAYALGSVAIFPILGALRCLYLLRSVTLVQIDPDHLRLRGPLLRKSIPWKNIARLRVKDRSVLVLDERENIVLYDSTGRKLGVIRAIFDKSPQLLREIEIRSSASRGETTSDQEKDKAETHKYKRREHVISSIVMLALAALMTPVAVFLLNWRLAEESLASKGHLIDAKITRHWFITDSFWLDYEFTVDGRHYQREVRMDRTPWNDLTHSKTVPIRYAPAHPWINRPLAGEQPIQYPHIFEFLVGFICFCVVRSLLCLLQYFLVGRSLFSRNDVRSRWL